jgi:leucyl-tRNA synthetase
MASYNPGEIEKKWQKYWSDYHVYPVDINPQKPKYYVLDMFPYPSGEGLHVGHPLGYIASDIISRYKRLKGFNVLHPMGFDSFGLPAEQFAIDTGQHPAITTEQNIKTFKSQLEKIGFSYDWSREVRTSDPAYYKWTQWIFIQIFNSWFDTNAQKAKPIQELIEIFEKEGNKSVHAYADEDIDSFTADDWKGYDTKQQLEIFLKYRLTYLRDDYVNWCPALGTVLANDEVKDGFSERGGYPVQRKVMRQWSMRITAYADKLLDGLNHLDWSDALKEMQRNWIGKSIGCELDFELKNDADTKLRVFTTRPDTIFGVTYLVIAPESDYVSALTQPEQESKVKQYADWAKNRSERERQTEVKNVSGVFTGSYAKHPFNGESLPIWISEYVLAGYGTGLVMGVPASDERDFRFAQFFKIPIKAVIEGTLVNGEGEVLEAYTAKEGKLINSDFLNGLEVKKAIELIVDKIETQGLGKRKVNFRMRDAVFSRQRYWGEPVPVYFKDGIPQVLDISELPLQLPEIDEYKPTADGEPPLARANNWKYKDEYDYELTTMPGWAGSSWYFMRYADPKNNSDLASSEALNYWQGVDLYIGGTEHAVGHLLYSRFWTHLLYDLGYVPYKEPFQRLINQGMIQGTSAIIHRVKGQNTFVSTTIKDAYETSELHVPIKFVKDNVLNTEAFKNWQSVYNSSQFISSKDGHFYTTPLVEKMSKRYYNVVNPDDVVAEYGADALRLYEMFLGPIEQSKPWNTQGIDGVSKFLRKLWRLFHNSEEDFSVSEDAPSPEELKLLHKTIKRVEEDLERYSFNTVVSTMMIAVNELSAIKCNKVAVLKDILILLAPYAPHITEELWSKLGNKESIHKTDFPKFNPGYLTEENFEYPVSVNGKLRTKLTFPLDMPVSDIEKLVLTDQIILKWTEGKPPKKVVVVPKKIVNVVL